MRNRERRPRKARVQVLDEQSFVRGGMPRQAATALSATVTIHKQGDAFDTVFTAPTLHTQLLCAASPWRLADFHAEVRQLSALTYKLTLLRRPDLRTLSEVAQLGKILFEAVFPTSDMQAAIRNILLGSQKVSLAILSQDVSIPAQLLYIGNDTDRVDPELFLGMRSAITRTLRSAVCYDSQQNQPRNIRGTKRLSYAWDASFAYVAGQESTFITGMPLDQSLGDVFVSEVSELLPNSPSGENCRTLFNEMNGANPHIVHLSCHYEDGNSMLSKRFRLRSSAHVSYQDMRAENVSFQTRPFLFFNACDGAEITPDRTENFLDFCLRIGARCVVAPDCKLDDQGAAHFAEQFYRQLFTSGQSISAVAHHVSAAIYQMTGSLVGLAYGVFGQPYVVFHSGVDHG